MSPLLLLCNRNHSMTEHVHQPIWTTDELRRHIDDATEANEILRKKASTVPPAQRQRATDTMTLIGRAVSDSDGELTKIDMLMKHPRFDAWNCNAQGVLDSWTLETTLRYDMICISIHIHSLISSLMNYVLWFITIVIDGRIYRPR